MGTASGMTMKILKSWRGVDGWLKLWVAYLAASYILPSLLPMSVRQVVMPPVFCALLATSVIARLRPRLDPMLRRALALLVAEAAWLGFDAGAAGGVPPATVIGILAVLAFAVCLVWRPSRILLGVLVGAVGAAAFDAIYQAVSAADWNLETATEALHATMRLAILVFAHAALTGSNREAEDALFEDEVFS